MTYANGGIIKPATRPTDETPLVALDRGYWIPAAILKREKPVAAQRRCGHCLKDWHASHVCIEPE